MATTEENKALVHHLIKEYWNQGNLAFADEFISADAVRIELFSPERLHGIAGAKQAIAGWRGAFPDLHLTANELIAEGDKVVIYWTFTGTHQGELNGIAPTGKPVTVSGITIMKIVSGKITEEIVSADLLSLMTQLGVLAA